MIKNSRNAWLLVLILAYSIAVISLGIANGPLSPDEARQIFMGRETVSSWRAAGVGSSPEVAELVRANLGSAVIAPAVIALADAAIPLYGARLLCGLLGLLLIVLIYFTANTQHYGKHGLLAASTFVFLGMPLQLFSCAGSAVFAALFLGASLWCVESSSSADGSGGRRKGMLLLGGLSLALAAMTSYLVALFLLPVVLFVFLRHRFSDAVFFFALPFFVMLFIYGYFAVLPDWAVLERRIISPGSVPGILSGAPFVYVFNWVTMPYLLATVGLFHEEGRKNSFFLMLLAAPAFLVPFVSTDVNDVHAVALLSVVLLAPASAIGVVQMADIFSANNGMALAKPFFVTAILIIIWTFGVQQIKDLRRERPDLSSAVAFLSRHAAGSSTTVLVDSDYGSPEYVYDYYLNAKSPPMRVVPAVRADSRERRDLVARMQPNYVVVDGYHSNRSFNEASRDYLEEGFAVVATYKMSLVSGDNIIKVFKRGVL